MSTLYRRCGKRAFDLSLALAALVITAPVQIAAGIAVRRNMGSPVLFRQDRPGLEGIPFTILKFRTMIQSSFGGGSVESDSERLTRLGGFLRSSSIDELPELWNVVRGDMSLVGPRPLLMEYLPRYTPEQARRHELLPGITGWAQVNGRNSVSWEEKFALDVWYVDNVSFGLDIRILWRTISSVVHQRGIAAEGHATAPEFLGQQEDRSASEQP